MTRAGRRCSSSRHEWSDPASGRVTTARSDGHRPAHRGRRDRRTRRRAVHDGRGGRLCRSVGPARPRRPAHPPAGTRLRGRRGHRHRIRRRRCRWLHGSGRDGQHQPRVRHRRGGRTGRPGVPPTSDSSTSGRSARSRSGWPVSGCRRWGNCTTLRPQRRLLLRRRHPGRRQPDDAPGHAVRGAVGCRHLQPLRGRVAHGRRPDERRPHVGAAGHAGLAARGRGGHDRPRPDPGGEPRGEAARAPRVHRRQCRVDSAGQGRAASGSLPRSPRTTSTSTTASSPATTRSSRSTRPCAPSATRSRCAWHWPTGRSTPLRPTMPPTRTSRRTRNGTMRHAACSGSRLPSRSWSRTWSPPGTSTCRRWSRASRPARQPCVTCTATAGRWWTGRPRTSR